MIISHLVYTRLMQIQDNNSLLVKAIKQVLKPLVKFLIYKQIPLATLVEIIKSAYVEVAEKEFAIDDNPPTDSRINVLTGVHRKDVKRLRDHNDIQQPSEHLSIHSLMLASWMAEEPYAKNNESLPLNMTGPNSFESLADMYTRQNIRATSILQNWLEMGWVIKDEQSLIHLNLDAVLNNQLGEDQLYFFSQNLADHMATSTGNLVNKKKELERAVFYNGLTRDSIQTLNTMSKQQAVSLLKSINKEALALQKQDKKSNKQKYRFRLGTYFFSDLDHD